MKVLDISRTETGTQVVVQLHEERIKQHIKPGRDARIDASAKSLADKLGITGTFDGVDLRGFQAQYSYRNNDKPTEVPQS